MNSIVKQISTERITKETPQPMRNLSVNNDKALCMLPAAQENRNSASCVVYNSSSQTVIQESLGVLEMFEGIHRRRLHSGPSSFVSVLFQYFYWIQ